MEDNKDSTRNPCSENCCCQKPGTSSDNETPSTSETSSSDSAAASNPPKDKKGKLTLTSLGLNFRRGKSLQFTSKKNKKTSQPDSPSSSNSSIKKSPKWGLKFSSTKSKESKVALTSDTSNANPSASCCQCVNYKEPEEDPVEECEAPQLVGSEECEKVPERQTTVTFVTASDVACVSSLSGDSDVVDPNGGIYGLSLPGQMIMNGPLLDVAWLSGLHHQDCDEAARLARAREIEQGVEAPPGFRQVSRVQLVCSDGTVEPTGSQSRTLQLVCPPDLTVDSLRVLFQTHHMTLRSCPADNVTGCHTQIDFIHCLVPDLYEITNCSFYWGKIDRYEAERLLDGKPEGTFLLRDSAQEEFLFSVSFRKYGRSLHARIEQWNHKFSFDAHDPGVYTSDTVCGLIEHYKDPSGCMFFEPMLTWPLHRNFTFSLQHLCRSVIVKRLTYDNINLLQLPKSLKTYMKEYHYRQKVRVARFDDDVQWLEVRNVPP